MPNTESIPIFQGPGLPEYMKNEYIRYRCRELQLHVHRPELPELCKKHIFSISAVIHQTALGRRFCFKRLNLCSFIAILGSVDGSLQYKTN